MARRITRTGLIEEAESEFAALSALIERVPAEGMTGSGVNSAGWSLKDVLAHVAEWAARCEAWCRAGERGEHPAAPAPGFKWSETPAVNAAIYEARKGQALKGVLADLRRGHVGLIKVARTMDERKLLTPGVFAWAGPTWAVAHHVRANTGAHYRWAGKHFRRWLKEHGSRVERPKGAGKGAKGPRGSCGV